MNIPGIIQSYDPRAASSAAMNRAIMAPHYVPVNAYSGDVSGGIIASHQQQQQSPLQQNPFSFSGAYTTTGVSNGLVPAFANNFIQQRPLPPLMQPESDADRAAAYQHSNRRGYVEEHQRESPIVKPEPQWSISNTSSTTFMPANSKVISSIPVSPGAEVHFGTEVDTLMKAIQAKSQTSEPQPKSSPNLSRPVVGVSVPSPNMRAATNHGLHSSVEVKDTKLTYEDIQDDQNSQKGSKKRYQCKIIGCSKSFYQKTHLDIHERAHTGDKPYPCKEPGCGRSFSQLGNLKTHERRHTGERPYKCDICDKRFAQRGNVRAHRIVHEQAKPYLCRLDDCGKQFTQLGNLKSHQNKFHIATIRNLTNRFASIQDGDIVPAADKELWEYFADLYKNSNKGIKGRGKDRKVGPNHMSINTNMRGLGGGASGGYSMSGAGRGNMVMGVMGAGRGNSSQYEMFDADDASQSSGQSGSTIYDDAPCDAFEDQGRSGDLAFGDRIY